MVTRDADMAQLVEHHLAKVGVAGSNPVVRSTVFPGPAIKRGRPLALDPATWPSGKAEACKAFTPGSNPGVASKRPNEGPLPGPLSRIRGLSRQRAGQPCGAAPGFPDAARSPVPRRGSAPRVAWVQVV